MKVPRLLCFHACCDKLQSGCVFGSFSCDDPYIFSPLSSQNPFNKISLTYKRPIQAKTSTLFPKKKKQPQAQSFRIAHNSCCLIQVSNLFWGEAPSAQRCRGSITKGIYIPPPAMRCPMSPADCISHEKQYSLRVSQASRPPQANAA